jgi:hypothetical protein
VDAPTPVIGVDAASAPDDPGVARMVSTYGALLAGAGLCLGTVTFYDAPGWARDRFGTGVSGSDAGPCGDLEQLFTLSIPGARTLDLFLVSRIGGGTGHLTIIGVDGEIPGPATVNGTVVSGALASAEDLLAGSCPADAPPAPKTCGADLVAYIAAHESGHFLGLYHTTERAGSQYDPLVDTPHCECSRYCGFAPSECSAGLSPARCDQHYERCSGGRNLMFWAIDLSGASAPGGYLSPEQGRVVRASPLVRSP